MEGMCGFGRDDKTEDGVLSRDTLLVLPLQLLDHNPHGFPPDAVLERLLKPDITGLQRQWHPSASGFWNFS